MASNAKALSFLSGDLSLSGTEVSINVAGSVQSDSITGSTITMKNTGSTIVASDGSTAVLSENGGVVTVDADVSTIGSATISGGSITGTEIDLKSSGTTIFASDGTTAVLSESSGTVTIDADVSTIGSATISGGSITGTEIDLKSSGTTIFASDGTTAVLSENGGVVTVDADNYIIDNAGKISSVGQIELQIDTDNNQSGTYIGFSRNNTTSERLALFQENGDISFYEDTGTTPKLFWDASAESLGIGTSSPTTFGKLALQVAGTTTPTNATNVGPSSVNLYAATNGSSTNSTVGIFGWHASQPGLGSGIGFSRENAGDWGTQIRFYTHPTTTSNVGDITERMRIDSSGKLLVGTVSNTGIAGTGVKIKSNVIGTPTEAALVLEGTGGDFYAMKTIGTDMYLLSIASSSTHYWSIGSASGTGITILENGLIDLPGTYNNIVTSSVRDLHIQSGGRIGYTTSVRSSKTNIENLPSIAWIYELNPVKFQYRIRDEDDNYTDEAEPEIQYGLIAEDVVEVNSDLVFGDETENGFELRGIQYSRLIAPMIKAIQEQQTLIESQQSQIDALTARIEALENA